MRARPALPSLAAVPEVCQGGHLWLVEYLEGAPLRFGVRESGLVRFGDDERVYDAGEAPLPYRRAVGHVRERLDRDALRAAVDDVERVALFGVATQGRTVEYDWERLPPFLGTDVWTGEDGDGRFLEFDAVESAFERLGLTAVNALAREQRARDFDPEGYAMPASAWYDGPVAGVVVRRKGGGRGLLRNPDLEAPAPRGDGADAVASRLVTDERLERAIEACRRGGGDATAPAVAERLLETLAREAYGTLFGAGSVDVDAFESALAAVVRERLS